LTTTVTAGTLAGLFRGKELTEEQRRQALAEERALERLVLLAVGLTIGGIIPFMGLPGTAIFTLMHPLIKLLPGSQGWCCIPMRSDLWGFWSPYGRIS